MSYVFYALCGITLASLKGLTPVVACLNSYGALTLSVAQVVPHFIHSAQPIRGAADSIRIAPPQVSVPLSAIAELGTLSRSPVTAVLLRAHQIPSRIGCAKYRDNTGNLSAGEAGLEPTTYSFEG